MKTETCLVISNVLLLVMTLLCVYQGFLVKRLLDYARRAIKCGEKAVDALEKATSVDANRWKVD